MRSFEKISFKQFSEDIGDNRQLYDSYKLPERKSKNAAGYDFYLVNELVLWPGERKVIPTGVKAKYPDDEFLLLAIRSSIGFEYNIRLCNQVGIIDSDFYNNPENEGHIYLAIQNESDMLIKIPAGEAIAQGLFLKYYTCGDEVKDERYGWSLLDDQPKTYYK